MLGISGRSSAIAKALEVLLPPEEHVVDLSAYSVAAFKVPAGVDRFFFLDGILEGAALGQHGDAGSGTWAVNFYLLAEKIDAVLKANERARIVVMGSMSGLRGSYDVAYAGAKAALHLFVKTRPVGPQQQLVAIAPWIVADAGMTTRRADHENLDRLAASHPKGRFITSAEVAGLAYHLLYIDRGYLTGTVIELHGGMK